MTNVPQTSERRVIAWQRGPSAPQLAQDHVHIWSVWLDSVSHLSDWCETLLSPDERVRAERFRRDVDRRQFVMTRGVLRALLARYIGRGPGDVRFRYGLDGKPALHPCIGSRLRFNLSHAASVALYAIGQDRDVGIDVEPLSPDTRDRRTRLEKWTHMEAYVKARGTSLAGFIDATHHAPIDVDAVARRQGWICEDVPLPGCVAVVAVQGAGWVANHWSLDATWLAASRRKGRAGTRSDTSVQSI